MAGQRLYKNSIWTNHALERLGQRGLSQDIAWRALQFPDGSKQVGDTTEYRKQVGNSTVTVIVKRNERNEKVVLSCWVNPPLPNTADFRKREAYLKYQRSSIWGKLWITVKRNLLGIG